MVDGSHLLPECQRDPAIAIPVTVLVVYLFDSALYLPVFFRGFQRFQMIIKSTSGYLGNPQKLVKRIMLPQLVYNPDFISYRTEAFSFCRYSTRNSRNLTFLSSSWIRLSFYCSLAASTARGSSNISGVLFLPRRSDLSPSSPCLSNTSIHLLMEAEPASLYLVAA